MAEKEKKDKKKVTINMPEADVIGTRARLARRRFFGRKGTGGANVTKSETESKSESKSEERKPDSKSNKENKVKSVVNAVKEKSRGRVTPSVNTEKNKQTEREISDRQKVIDAREKDIAEREARIKAIEERQAQLEQPTPDIIAAINKRMAEQVKAETTQTTKSEVKTPTKEAQVYDSDPYNLLNSYAEKYAPGDEEFKKVVHAIALTESGGDPRAAGDYWTDDDGVNRAHSYGLFQANVQGGRGQGHKIEDLQDAEYNIKISVPELYQAYTDGINQGLSGADLVAHVSRGAQRPAEGLEWKAAQNYGRYVNEDPKTTTEDFMMKQKKNQMQTFQDFAPNLTPTPKMPQSPIQSTPYGLPSNNEPAWMSIGRSVMQSANNFLPKTSVQAAAATKPVSSFSSGSSSSGGGGGSSYSSSSQSRSSAPSYSAPKSSSSSYSAPKSTSSYVSSVKVTPQATAAAKSVSQSNVMKALSAPKTSQSSAQMKAPSKSSGGGVVQSIVNAVKNLFKKK